MTAKNAGVPQDQVRSFLEVGYVPLPWQWQFHAAARAADQSGGPIDIGCGGARGPGKSHAVLSQAGLDDCQRVPRLKGLFLRQTAVSAKESFDDLIEKALRGKVKYERSGQVLHFSNGSRIFLGGFKDENDIDKYVGVEYDFIIIEELNQLTEKKYTMLRGSLRTSKPNWRPRLYTSFNPGGIGHAFVKKRYILPYRKKEQVETRFIPSTYKSNPHLNKEYTQYLESLSGDLGKAWREGEWDLFAGQYFDEWRESLHKIHSFIPRPKSLIVGGLDWGRANPFALELDVITKVFSSETSFYRARTFLEVYGREKKPSEWSEIIQERLAKFNLTLSDIAWVRADPKIFSKGDDGGKSIKDQFIDADERWRTILKPANNDRIAGWTIMHDWLSVAPDGLPYWQIAESCTATITTLPELIHDENVIEDVETNRKGGIDDDAGDAHRYKFKHLKWLDGKVGGYGLSDQKEKKPNFLFTPEKTLTTGLKSEDFAIPLQGKRGVYIE